MAATRHGNVNGLRIVGIPCLTNLLALERDGDIDRAAASFGFAGLSSR
jgi:hypothetical protein